MSAVRWRMAGAYRAELHRFRRSPVGVARGISSRKTKGIKDIGSVPQAQKWDNTVEYPSEPRRAVHTHTALSDIHRTSHLETKMPAPNAARYAVAAIARSAVLVCPGA